MHAANFISSQLIRMQTTRRVRNQLVNENDADRSKCSTQRMGDHVQLKIHWYTGVLRGFHAVGWAKGILAVKMYINSQRFTLGTGLTWSNSSNRQQTTDMVAVFN